MVAGRRARRSLLPNTRSGVELFEASTVDTRSEPVLIGPGKPSLKHDFLVYEAVDYRGIRFRPGDHISMYTPDGEEWVCNLEVLFRNPETNQPMFGGRWFWSVADVEVLKGKLIEKMRPSKCKSYELIASDNRDTNLVETISRKCTILSFDNFQLVKKAISKLDCQNEKVFFCERQYHHRVYRFSELNNLLFPGDPIPPTLRKAAGLIDEPTPIDDEFDLSHAYYEPKFAGPVTKRRSKSSDRSSSVSSDPILLW